MTPTIGRGTQLSIGEVQSIKHSGVVIRNAGNEFTVSHAFAAQIHDEDERAKNAGSTATVGKG